MKHFKQEEWADFARGLAGRREGAMRKHIQACKPCREAAEMWEQLMQIAKREASLAPPESAVHIAKSYAANLPPGKPSLLTRVAELILDTRREPALAGVRSSATASPRHLLYRSGDYEIDLQIERAPGSERVVIVGQILSTAGKSVSGLPVALISGIGREASGATNEFGEFHLEFQAGQRVQVCIWLYGATSNLLIPLDMEREEPKQPTDTERIRGGQ